MKHDLAHKLGLHIRDLRVIDPAPESRIESAVFVSPKLVIMSVEGIKLIITQHEALIFSPETQIVNSFVADLKSHFDDVDRKGEKVTKFVQDVLETALSTACNRINSDLIEVSDNQDLSKVLASEFQKVISMSEIIRQAELFNVKIALRRIEKRALEFSRSLAVLAEDDELLLDSILCTEPETIDMTSGSWEGEQGGDGGAGGDGQRRQRREYWHTHDEDEDAHGEEDEEEQLETRPIELLNAENIIDGFIIQSGWLASEADALMDAIANKEGGWVGTKE